MTIYPNPDLVEKTRDALETLDVPFMPRLALKNADGRFAHLQLEDLVSGNYTLYQATGSIFAETLGPVIGSYLTAEELTQAGWVLD